MVADSALKGRLRTGGEKSDCRERHTYGSVLSENSRREKTFRGTCSMGGEGI